MKDKPLFRSELLSQHDLGGNLTPEFCCDSFLGTRRAFPVGGLQVGERGQGRVNPGETCFPAYREDLCYGRPHVLLGPRVIRCKSGVKSQLGYARAQIYDSLLARILNHLVVFCVCELDRRCV